MKKEEISYLSLLLVHVFIGLLVYTVPFTAKLYGYSIFIFGTIFILKSSNKNNEALLVAAYVVGSEVFLRMTGGNPLYEISKYGVLFFLLLGMYFSGFSKKAFWYWIFLILLIPSVIIATFALDLGTNIRTRIAFNISGPLCLGIASIYTYKRNITLEQINRILLFMGLPIVTCMVYLTVYTPIIKDVITGTESNFQTSGGFGPNQVSTILGLGMFVFFSRVLLASKTKLLVIINLFLALNISYRGFITFSRGGMITGLVMIFILLAFLYIKSNDTGKAKLKFSVVLIVLAMLGVWMYASFQTGGLINKRYANQDAAGRVKASQFTGRENLVDEEIDIFLNNPLLGAGVGKVIEIRESETGKTAASHNEITRMLAEHGALGIIGLLILIFTPFVLYFEYKFNVFLLCFVTFWLLTINHAAMRTAAPAFVYALSLLIIRFESPAKNEK